MKTEGLVLGSSSLRVKKRRKEYCYTILLAGIAGVDREGTLALLKIRGQGSQYPRA